MADDLTLLELAELTCPIAPPDAESVEAFHVTAAAVFHKANPWVMEALVTLTKDLANRGHQRVGIGMLWEVLRWQWMHSTYDPATPGQWRLNNNYRAWYAREIMRRHPDLDGIFETRTIHT